MENSDFEEFKKRLMAAGELYDKKVSPTLLDMYWQSLTNITLDQFIHGLNRHAVDPKHGAFWPKPADIVRGIEADQTSIDDRAQLAWSVIVGSISRIGGNRSLQVEDRQAMAVVEAMGGWMSICMTYTDKLDWKRKEFMSIYRTYEKTPIDQLPANLPGREEIENHKRNGGSLKGLVDASDHRGLKQIAGKHS